MKRIIFSLLYFFVFFELIASAPDEPFDYTGISFNSYTTDDGLSNNKINCFIQDNKGFIWIGTESGLNRFDGISFKNYYYINDDSASLSDSRVYYLLEDSAGNLWVFTSKGLNLYNRKEDNFIRIILKTGNETNVSHMNCGFIDHEGNMWVAAWGSILRFKVRPNYEKNIIETKQYHLFEPDLQYDHNFVYSFFEDPDHTLWVTSSSKYLYYFDKNTDSFHEFRMNLPDSDNLLYNRKQMLAGDHGELFIVIQSYGLVKWNRKENRYTVYSSDGTNSGPNFNGLLSFAKDQSGNLWIGENDKGGINIFNQSTGKFSYILSKESDPFSLGSNKVTSVYSDRCGSMWIGTIKGFSVFHPDRQKFRRYYHNPDDPFSLNVNNVLCFSESKSGEIWIGTDGGGLNRLNRKTGKFTHYTNKPGDPQSISSNAVVSICEDHEGVLWLGTYNGGLVRMKDNLFTSYKPDWSDTGSVASPNIWYVLEDSRNHLWVATLNMGLDLFDRETGRFHHYRKENGDSLGNNSIIRMFEDSKQNIYITTYSGVSYFNLNDCDFSKEHPVIRFKNFVHDGSNPNSISSSVIYCVNEDKEGIIWFGTMGAGIDRFNPKTGEFRNYSVKNGLPGENVNSILVDENNNLWLGTNKGLAVFSPETEKIRTFNNYDGLQNVNIYGGAIKTRKGEMFFGGPNGFNSFDPEKINLNKNIPPVWITGLRIFNNSVRVNEKINNRIILKEDIGEIKELVLTHKEEFFSIEFIALDYTAPGKNEYAYKLEGFNKDWVYCGNKREAHYTSLRPGKYRFLVKACNNDGIWNEAGTSLKIIILPPWWDTLLFKILLSLMMIAAGLSVYYYRVLSLTRQKENLERIVSERTAELERKTDFLNETNTILEERQQFIEEQSEELKVQTEELNEKNGKLRKLNATKDKFFSIIAHDLKNPFTSILGFSELLSQRFDKLDDTKKRQYSDSIFASASRIYKLLENLLQWARTQTGNIDFRPEEIDLYGMISENLLLMQDMISKKEIRIQNEALPMNHIFADKNMINTVIRNLLSNAVKFTEKGEIQIKTVLKDAFWELSIADNGTGIPEDKLKTLFDIGESRSSEGTRGETGTGLGLIICKEFVEKNKGSIRVESEYGKGSVFTISLPAC